LPLSTATTPTLTRRRQLQWRAAVAALRTDGYDVRPAYDSSMGGEIYEIVRYLAEGASSNKDVVLALITSVAAPIVGALAHKLVAKPAAPAPEITVIVGAASASAEPGITDAELLRRLITADPTLPQRVTPETAVRVEVRVPPRE